MRLVLDTRINRLERTHTSRILWFLLIVGSGIFLSKCFACVTPFAALAAVAALKLSPGDTAGSIGLVWLSNQAIGFLLLGYPWTWDCAAWGFAIGLSTGLAVLAARSLTTSRPAPLAVSLPFMAAFASFELSLYVVGFVLPGSAGAFSAAVIWQVFVINAVALCALMAAYQLVMLMSQLTGTGSATAKTANAISYR